MIKPIQIFLFLVSVFLGLLLFALLLPSDGLRINEEYKISFVKLEKIFSLNDTSKVVYKDIKGIIEAAKEEAKDSVAPDVLSFIPKHTEEETSENSLLLVNDSIKEVIKLNIDALKKKVSPIQYPNNDLHPLRKFLKKIALGQEKIRILHYGDSQIELDRISSYLRHRLRERFGGSGVGLLPAFPLFDNTISMKHKNIGDWKRYSAYTKPSREIEHDRYGALASFARVSYNQNDSLEAVNSIFLSPNSSKMGFNIIQIFYANNDTNAIVEAYWQGELIRREKLKKMTNLSTVYWELETKIEDIELRFTNTSGYTDVFAISLETNNGIVVDNISLRGSSGTFFTKLDKQHYMSMISQISPDFVILQFGGNVMPYIKEEKQCVNYAKSFKKQIQFLQKMLPEASFMLIGPSDMSTKIDGEFVTFPFLPSVNKQLKKVAFECNIAYWDMFKAMGGENSMPSWVESDPPLATKDYVHLTGKGAEAISNLLYNALDLELNKYLIEENEISENHFTKKEEKEEEEIYEE